MLSLGIKATGRVERTTVSAIASEAAALYRTMRMALRIGSGQVRFDAKSRSKPFNLYEYANHYALSSSWSHPYASTQCLWAD